ncbi:MAG: glycosyltransferase [Pirellulales bacterium]
MTTAITDDRPVILQVLHRMGVGGAEVLVDRMVRNMSDRFQFVIACLDEVGTLGEGLRTDGVQVVDLKRGPGLDLQCARRLGQLANKIGADLIHCHQYTPYFYGVTARGIFGRLPIVFTEHGRHHPDQRKWKRVLFNRIADRSSDRVIGVGEAVKRALVANEGFHEKRVGVIYNGVPLAPIMEATADREGVRREFDVPQNGKIIIQVARLDYLKDHITAVRAVRELTTSDALVYWLVVGDGPERAAIEREIQTLGVENVRLAGERSDVPRLLRASDVMLLSSISEGIPLTLIEGMAAELPIVSTSVGGVCEVVQTEKHGCLVPASEPSRMSEQLKRVLVTPGLATQFGQAGRERAIQMFDEKKMHQHYRELYDDAV